MALDKIGRTQLGEFFDEISKHASVFEHATFHYVALADRGRWVILSASLVLHSAVPPVVDRRFESPRAKAGVFALDKWPAARAFLTKITEGFVETPHGRLEFPGAAGASPVRHAFNHILFNPIGNQQRIDTAQVMGEQSAVFISQPMLDWSLRAATVPYDGLDDLITDFGLLRVQPAISVHVIAQCGAMIDASSRVDGNKATVGMLLASGLDPNLASLGVLVRHQTALDRRHFSSTEIKWEREETRQIAHVQFDVPPGALLHCFANYDGITHHRYWVTDPSQTQNNRRTAFEALGLGIQTIDDLIADAQADSGVSRKFETAAAWLMWLLGLNPAHLGDTPRAQDAPDILVATPTGHIAVIECTTGLVKQEKLLKLRARTLAVRQRLDAASLSWLHVTPVVVCARPKQEVEPERGDAANMGISIIDADDLRELFRRTSFAPDPERFYQDLENTVAQRRTSEASANST